MTPEEGATAGRSDKENRSEQVGHQESISDSGAGGSAKSFAKAHCTDLGNARRLVAQHGENLRYCPQHKTWLVWDGARWVKDEDGEVFRRAKAVVQTIYFQAYREGNHAARDRFARWAIQSEARARLEAMVKLAETELGIPVSASELDANPMLLGVANGVIDLRTGELREPRREDYMTKQARASFDPSADCPRWRAFLHRIFDHNEEVIAYVQRAVGYCLTGSTREQCLFILYGLGANGKTVFFRVVQALLGDYAMATPPETLMLRKNAGGPSPDLARLHGARLAIATEPKDDCVFAEQVVKQITGQDRIVCRDLYSKHFEYIPQFKVWLATNHKPIIRGDDHAIWRRIRLIPLMVTIPPKEQDKHLIEKLQAELSGILNWALKGALAYQGDGLTPPKFILDATQEYRDEMDIVGEWIAERAIEDRRAKTSVEDLYACYRGWCQSNNHRFLSKKRFSQKLEKRGFQKTRTSQGRFFVGLKLEQINSGDLMNQTISEPFDTG